MVTHNPNLTTYASRVITMLDGKIDTDTQLIVPVKPKIEKRPLSQDPKKKVKKAMSRKKRRMN